MIPKHILEKVDKGGEVHMRAYFERNDLPGPGSTHNQIFEAGARFMYELLSPELEKAKFSAEREDQSNALSVEHNMLTIKALEAKLKAREAQVECYEEGLKYISKAVAYLDQSMCRRVIKACSEIASEALAKGKAMMDAHKGRYE